MLFGTVLPGALSADIPENDWSGPSGGTASCAGDSFTSSLLR